MPPDTTSLIAAALYVLLGRLLMHMRNRARAGAFALLNLAAVYYFFFRGKDERFTPLFFCLSFLSYVALVSALYIALRIWGNRAGWVPWLAVLLPIALLAVIRYSPAIELARMFTAYRPDGIRLAPQFTIAWVCVGFSYLALRSSHLALEVRNGVVSPPGYADYLGFALFVPTLSVGPISPYSQYERAFTGISGPGIPIGPALLRVLIGAVKYRFLGPVLNQLTYSGLLLDGHPHLWIDVPVAVVAYYLYLYCNFSGFCDIAIGAAGLMGIPVAENFDNPFAARNVQDFWNRWHITLSQYMRDVVFSPLSKSLIRIVGSRNATHAVAIAILVVFLLVGVWHGIGMHYAAFGAVHAAGVAGSFYYTIALKKWLGKEGFAAYNRNRWIHGAAVAVTFLYVAASMILFANDRGTIHQIVSMLRMR